MRPENNTKKMCFYKFVATLLLSLTHKTSKTLQINRLHQIKNILHREETKEAIFNRLITLNPALKTLVDTFDLQLVNVEKASLSATVQRTRKGLFKR